MYMASIMNEPCAKLMMRSTPKIRLSPRAMPPSMAPTSTPLISEYVRMYESTFHLFENAKRPRHALRRKGVHVSDQGGVGVCLEDQRSDHFGTGHTGFTSAPRFSLGQIARRLPSMFCEITPWA